MTTILLCGLLGTGSIEEVVFCCHWYHHHGMAGSMSKPNSMRILYNTSLLNHMLSK